MISSTSYGAPSEEDTAIRVDTLMRGVVEVQPSQILEFAGPLIGFAHLRRFVLLQTDRGPLYWLQSLEEREAAFCVLAPFQAGLDPDLAITPQDLISIGATDTADVDVYTMLVLDRDPAAIRTNLRAPILVSRSTNRARQVVLDDPQLPVQFFLKELLRGRRA